MFCRREVCVSLLLLGGDSRDFWGVQGRAFDRPWALKVHKGHL